MTHLYSFAFSQKNVNVKIDPRIEAITIFYTLATRDTLDEKPTPSTYYKDFDNYFDKYKDHKSLNWYRNLDSWDGYDLSSIGLYLSDQYPFKLKIPYNGKQLRSSDINVFLEKFNDFYKDCKVDTFLKAHKVEYSNVTKSAQDAINESGILNAVNQFYNRPSNGEVIIFVDILNNLGNNAIPIEDKRFKGMKMFKLAYLKNEDNSQTNETHVKFVPLSNVVIHEISHLFVNDFIPLYKERLMKKRNLFLTTAKNEKLKETEWENELDELIVRVCVSKILGEKYGAEAEAKEVENQSKHFKYFKEFNLFFNNYTQNRDKYENISQFYPKIIEFIEYSTTLN